MRKQKVNLTLHSANLQTYHPVILAGVRVEFRQTVHQVAIYSFLLELPNLETVAIYLQIVHS